MPMPDPVVVWQDHYDDQRLILSVNGVEVDVVDFNPNPTWPSPPEMEQMVGRAVLKALDPNWGSE